MWNWYGMHGGYWLGGLGMWLFWIALVIALALVARGWLRVAPRGGTGESHETPLDILKRRYARGEIDRAEFDEKRRELS